MFAQGDKLWLCISFYALPLEAIAHASGRETLDSQGSESGQLKHGASESAAEEHYSGGNLECGPVAVLEKQRVLLANDAAVALGVRPGQATATARTLADGIRLLERNPVAEQRCLEQLCCWGYSLSPTLYPYGDNCLLLEVGSCMMIYGSIEALLSRIRSQLSQRGYSYYCGLAPTPKGALLFTRPLSSGTAGTPSEVQRSIKPLSNEAGGTTSEVHHNQGSLTHGGAAGPVSSRTTETPSVVHHYQRSRKIETHGATSEESEGDTLEGRLGGLPLRVLEEFPREVDALAKAGLWTIGDILALPRRALARRCGKAFVHYIEQVLGVAEDRAPDFSPPPRFSDHYWFGYEVKANQELLPAIQLLLQSLCRFLRNTQLQTQRLEWELFGVNRNIQRLSVHSSLSQANWQEWYRLTHLKIEHLPLAGGDEGGMGIEGIGLRCEHLVPGNAGTDDLFRQAGQREPLHSLLDRLKNRLGLQSVCKIACRDEHLPEHAGYSSPDTRPEVTTLIGREQRPFWLMPEPQQMREVAGQPCWNGRLTLLEGPERIEDNWWDEAVSRDYYVARDGNGQQYWIYRDRLQDHWYIQGVFH